MAETTQEQDKALETIDEVVKAETSAETPAQAEDKPKTTKKSKAKKQVNLDEEMDKKRPTFATGIQAAMRDLIANKGKK